MGSQPSYGISNQLDGWMTGFDYIVVGRGSAGCGLAGDLLTTVPELTGKL